MVTNEPGQGQSVGTFQTSLTNIISHVRAYSYPSSALIFSPLQDGIQGQAPYYPVLLSTATTQNTDYVYMRDRWGAAQAPAFLFGPDGFHENNFGNGEIFSAIYRSVVDVLPTLSTGTGTVLTDSVTGTTLTLQIQ